MVGLARAAVNGDEKALDLFSSVKGKKTSSNQFANSFFFGTADGKPLLNCDLNHQLSF